MKTKIPHAIFGKFGESEHDAFQCDMLDRREEIFALTSMIEHVASPTVMALDAPWGAGKTAFVKMWRRHLKNGQIPALYFNAWETDYAADPFVPFVDTLTKELSEENERKFMESARKLIESAKALIPAFAGFFAGDRAAKVAEDAVRHLLTHNDKIDEFKNALEGFAKVQKEKRVVVFVDELDRCRPDYAVKILERIKHLFEVPGIIFVLAINREQLCHSVRALYGAGIDADTYLRRFIDFDFTIKRPDMGNFIVARLAHLGVNNFLEERSTNSTSQDERYDLYQTLELLAKIYGYSPRDTEQLLMRVVLVLYALGDYGAKDKLPFYPVLLAFLVVARLHMPEHYRKYILPADDRGEMATQWENQLLAAGFYKRDSEYARRDYHMAANITAHIFLAKRYSMKSSPDIPQISDFIKSYRERVVNAAPGSEKIYRDDVASCLTDLHALYRGWINLPGLIKKIEILEPLRYQLYYPNKNDG